MAIKLRLIQCCSEFRLKTEIDELPDSVRGIYVLLKHRPKLTKKYDVVYIGMARRGVGGVKSRLLKHKRSVRKGSLWTHFSVYSVWPNISDDEVAELEGLFRHIYRRDTHANKLAKQKGFRSLKPTVRNNFSKWGNV
jgi:hypothetical protein